MFSLINKNAVDKPFHKSDSIINSLNSLASINNNSSNISIKLPREDAYICLRNSYISVDFEVVKDADYTRYTDGDELALVNFGLVPAFSEAKLSLVRGNNWKKGDNLHFISKLHKLLTSQQQASELD